MVPQTSYGGLYWQRSAGLAYGDDEARTGLAERRAEAVRCAWRCPALGLVQGVAQLRIDLAPERRRHRGLGVPVRVTEPHHPGPDRSSDLGRERIGSAPRHGGPDLVGVPGPVAALLEHGQAQTQLALDHADQAATGSHDVSAGPTSVQLDLEVR